MNVQNWTSPRSKIAPNPHTTKPPETPTHTYLGPKLRKVPQLALRVPHLHIRVRLLLQLLLLIHAPGALQLPVLQHVGGIILAGGVWLGQRGVRERVVDFSQRGVPLVVERAVGEVVPPFGGGWLGWVGLGWWCGEM